MEGPWQPPLENAATQPSASIPLARTRSNDPTELQGRLANTVYFGQPCAWQKVRFPSLDRREWILSVFVIMVTVHVVGHLLCVDMQLHNHTVQSAWLFPSYR